MRRWALVLLVVGASCRARLPAPPGLAIVLKAEVRARVEVRPVVAIVDAPVVEFFGVPLDDATDVVFVLDRSGSMSTAAQGVLAPAPAPEPGQPPPAPPRKIDVAIRELVDALERLPAGTPVNVIFFDTSVDAFAATLVPLADAERPGLVAYVKDTVPGGSTALRPAMRIAFLMNARRIVLLSDGQGNVGGDSAALLRDAREAIRGGIRIDTIGLGGDQDRPLLHTLAAESGGLYQPL